MQLIINELRGSSGDSKLESLLFSNGIVEIIYTNGDDGRRKKLEIKTEILCSDYKAAAGNIFFIKIEDIKDMLSIKNGVYIPDSDFPTFMDEVRSHYSLAYGLRVSKYRHIFSLVGSFHFAAILEKYEDINISYLNE